MAASFDLIVRNGTVVTPLEVIPDGAVGVQRQRISYVGPASELPANKEPASAIDAGGGWIVPGLIDLHIHGAGGADVATDLPRVCQFLVRHGVTAFLPTLVPEPCTPVIATVERVARELRNKLDGALPLGVHLEGPCLSPLQPGCLDPRQFLSPEDAKLDGLLAAGPSIIRIMTLAVELPGAQTLLRRLADRGILASLGHSAAGYEDVLSAMALGLHRATHVFNAMAGLHHRDTGAGLAILLEDGISCEVIADGVHVDPAMLKLLYRLKGRDRLMSVSDAAPPAGLEVDRAVWAGQQLIVDDGVCRTASGQLAGSATLLDGAVRTLVRDAGVPIADAVAMASLTPARNLGMDALRGSLERGKMADIAVFDREWHCRATIIAGRVAFQTGATPGPSQP